MTSSSNTPSAGTALLERAVKRWQRCGHDRLLFVDLGKRLIRASGCSADRRAFAASTDALLRRRAAQGLLGRVMIQDISNSHIEEVCYQCAAAINLQAARTQQRRHCKTRARLSRRSCWVSTCALKSTGQASRRRRCCTCSGNRCSENQRRAARGAQLAHKSCKNRPD